MEIVRLRKSEIEKEKEKQEARARMKVNRYEKADTAQKR